MRRCLCASTYSRLSLHTHTPWVSIKMPASFLGYLLSVRDKEICDTWAALSE